MDKNTDKVVFCSGPLLDWNLTWYTDDPDFTRCFHQTVLIYVPVGILFLLILSSSYFELRGTIYRGRVPRSVMNSTKALLIGTLIVLSLSEIIYGYSNGFPYDLAYYVRSGVSFTGYSVALSFQILCQRRGIVSSGILFTFWFLMSLGGAATYRSVLRFSVPISDGEVVKEIVPFVTFIIQYPIILTVFILSFWADNPPKYTPMTERGVDDDDDDEAANNLTPHKYSSFPSKVVFAWFDRFIWKTWKKNIKAEDLWGLTNEHRCNGILPLWERSWKRELEKMSRKNKPGNVFWALLNAFGDCFLVSAMCQLIYAILQFANPLIVNQLISFISSDDPAWKGYFFTALICLITFINTLLSSQSFYFSYVSGLKIRTALTSAIYGKAIRLGSASRKDMSVGETTNLMAIDSQRLMDFTLYANMMLSSPIQILLAMYFLWQILGPSSLAGLAIMALMVPLNVIVGSKMKTFTSLQMKNKDKRVKLMDEILNGIKVLKLYAWEPSFAEMVTDFRVEEISALKKSAILNAFTTFLWTSAPFLVALASFATFVLVDENNVLDANTAFVSLTLFNLLRIPLNLLPMMIVYAIQCRVSLDRINRFLNSQELDLDAVTRHDDNPYAIDVRNATLSWGRQCRRQQQPSNNADVHDEFMLKDIDLQVEDGSLVAIVGRVGSGKSSLLSALLGEMELKSGSINVRGRTVYAPQQAWLQNADLRYNVTFGKKYNKSFYWKVIEACSLKRDLEMLPAGDRTEIGEKGINLSGGQKQRISVARCVYNNGNVYYLDDPLSAVDSHVGKHIFDRVISSETGLLKQKTRILVTHGIGYLSRVDKIVVMKDGTISEIGTYRELLDRQGEFADYLIQYLMENQGTESEEGEEDKKEGNKDTIQEQQERENTDLIGSDIEEVRKDLEKVLGKKKLERRLSVRSKKSSIVVTSDGGGVGGCGYGTSDIDMKSDRVERTKQQRQTLIEDEKLEIDGVKLEIYWSYFKSIGIKTSFLSLLFYIGFQSFSLGANFWLSIWSTDPQSSTDVSLRNTYLSVYGILGFFQAVFIMLGSGCIAIGTLNGATKIHGRLLISILKAPLSYFDTTPLGRILNRFSKDIDVIDTTLPMNLRMLLSQLLNVVGTLLLICISIPLFIAVIVPIGFVYFFIQRIYIRCARQVKRIESISRSPIYSNFSETLNGISTIRAFELQRKFIRENEIKIDFNQKCYFPTFVSNRWLAVRLEMIGNLLLFFSALLSVLSRDTLDPGSVGLVLSYSLMITTVLNMLVRMSTEVETNMVSVERIREYETIVQEAPFEDGISDTEMELSGNTQNWPEYGVIKFDHYQTRYRDGLDLVIKGLNCEIHSGEKIGIVGRTGAGKSSLTLALFRIIEPVSGSIYIDNVNIRFLGLRKLRTRLTIIPQDPVLFSGTLKMNLDPFNVYSDRELWIALERAHLRTFVSLLPQGLQHEINEGGSNLSIGQRQLVCLARALLRKTKILILDEATAAVDLETDDLIQSTIRTEFVDCTVLTIAHRLKTIMDSNRIMVLGDGLIKEFETPERLLADPSSIFYGMAQDEGIVDKI